MVLKYTAKFANTRACVLVIHFGKFRHVATDYLYVDIIDRIFEDEGVYLFVQFLGACASVEYH